MSATIKIKNSSTTGSVPSASNLVQGELAVNVTDLGLYTENASGTVVKLNAPSIDDKNTGATKHVTIDTSGNLGLGVTPSSWSLGKALEVGAVGNALWYAGSTTDLRLNCNVYYNSGYKYGANGYATYYSMANGAHTWYNAASGTAGNAITFTQAMTLTAGGDLGVGGTSPYARISAYVASSGTFQNAFGATNSANSDFTVRIKSGVSDINNSAGALTFSTIDTERARIDSSGNLLVGTTTANGVITTQANLATQNGLSIKDTQNSSFGSGQTYVVFTNSSGSGAGSIQHTATTTVNYATSSDARLKTSLGVATDTSVIDNTIIHDFEWKEDGRIDRGVFAQEAYEVKPFAVSVGTDELTEDETLKHPWGVDYSKYVPDLIVYAQQLKKQVQELKAEFEAYKAAHP